MSQFPTVSNSMNDLSQEDNKPWLVTHRSKRSLIPLLAWAMLTAYAAQLWSVSTPAIRIPEFIPYLGGIRLGTLWLIPSGLFLEVVRRYFNDLYIFNSRRITHQKGRVSLRYNVSIVKYVHIRAITVTQSILGRFLNYGDVFLGTSAEDNSELMIIGVRNPRGLAKIIDTMRINLERITPSKEAEIKKELLDVGT
ncbi:MAG: PH domain-containing protein [bacterium]|nr:PH domain-containing protein [bacterium]